ncbi:hypothetical protein EC968_008466 [Mortierella alpina]|nr:hypothetical protein EC968_008466 [Mortierella alpina]
MNTLPDPCLCLIASHLTLSSARALLCLNKHWFAFATHILYRDPFKTLRELPLDHDDDEIFQKLSNLLELLLRCCFEQAQLTTVPPPDNTLYDPPPAPAPLIDYLALYKDQTSRYYNFLSDRGCRLWHKGTIVPVEERYDRVRIAFASHLPENVSHLYCSMASLVPLTTLAPRFSHLQSLRIVQLSGKDESIEPLYTFIARHRSSHRISELRALSFVKLAFRHDHHPVISSNNSNLTSAAISNPLVLHHWTNLQRVDLTHYQGMIDWHLIPRRHLVDLRFSTQSLCTPFEPSELLRPCARLETLHILNLEPSSLTWLQSQPAQPTTPLTAPLPRLHSLGLGGAITGLIPSLAIAVDVFSERLLSLTISLQHEPLGSAEPPERIHFAGNSQITLRKPLPKLAKLVLRDKALFELDPMVLTDHRCPSLRVLDLGVNAERSGPGCTELGAAWTVKWIKLRNVFRRIQAWKGNRVNRDSGVNDDGNDEGDDDEDDDGDNDDDDEGAEEDTLEEVWLRGFFSFTSAGLADILRPFKRLKRLYLGEARYILDYTTGTNNRLVNDICQDHKELTFLQATRFHLEGWIDLLPPRLELALTGYNSLFEQIDEQEVLPL